MSCEHLVCAACAGQVVDGGCPVCREGRAALHRHGGIGAAPWLLLLAVLLALLTVLAVTRAGL